MQDVLESPEPAPDESRQHTRAQHARHASTGMRLAARPEPEAKKPRQASSSSAAAAKASSTVALARPATAAVGGAHNNVSMRVPGEIAKEEVTPEQFDVEVAFYRRVAAEQDALGGVMPALLRLDEDLSPRAMILEDVADLVLDPIPAAASPARVVSAYEVCVMDLKLGLRSFRADVSNEAKASYFDKFAELRRELGPVRCAEVWASLGQPATGPPALARGALGKRDYLLFRDATTTSSKHGYRLTALRHSDFAVSQSDSRTVVAMDGFVKVLDRFLSGPQGFDDELAAGYIE
jgi:hypothetical protein